MNNSIFLVSIIIPSYNMEEYIGKNLRHLVEAQHINQVEIIVVKLLLTISSKNIPTISLLSIKKTLIMVLASMRL